jgi:phosphoribosylaminoimidazolecarboxamide formyltransferase/IMP cyclohydrolase
VLRIQRALVSVSDKNGIIEFAGALRDAGVEIISTGGTASTLRDAGIAVKSVAEVTGYPEILDGRVKTLHPKIHGGLLAVPDNPDHVRQSRELGIEPIDMVVVNLYPFEATIAREGTSLDDAVEQIDIGGPAMLRSSAKNFRHKAVVTSPSQYRGVLDEMRSSQGHLSESTCALLAREAFRYTASYDTAIAGYLESRGEKPAGLPAVLRVTASQESPLRYGENPHQRAALYGGFTSLFRKLHGKDLSYNNIMDISAAATLVAEFDEPTVAIVKHTNPCGVGSAPTIAEAYAKALATDRASAFGGIVAANRPIEMQAAELINDVFTEAVVAPEIAPPVLEFFRRKKERRIVELTTNLRGRRDPDVRSVPGGFLVQEPDTGGAEREGFRVVTRRAPTTGEADALRFAWRIAKHVKSNAIVYARADRTLGIGAGQMSRVDAARIAGIKAEAAGLDLRGSVAASDAFFPFADGLLEVVRAGSTAVIQPGGSVRDVEVITAADQHGVAMVVTGTRHFRH